MRTNQWRRRDGPGSAIQPYHARAVPSLLSTVWLVGELIAFLAPGSFEFAVSDKRGKFIVQACPGRPHRDLQMCRSVDEWKDTQNIARRPDCEFQPPTMHLFSLNMGMQYCTDETRPSEADVSLDLSTKRMIASTGTRSLAWSSRTVEGKGISPSVTCSLCSVPRLESVRGR